MKQIIQNFKTGELSVQDVPPPARKKGMILIQNRYSLISAGTEKSTVEMGESSLIQKARKRPDLVKQVIQNVRREGVAATYDKVRNRLESLKALGYSSAGRVLEAEAGAFGPGDRVACGGGGYAVHAEVISVPKNLVVKIPKEVTDKEAAFATLGAIAVQGLRQANLELGHSVCVIGLGLLGQLTVQLLRASGCRVMGIDVSPRNVELALKMGADASCARDAEHLPSTLNAFTRGRGFDRVIITAATPTNDPIELAGEICRRKGIIVVVGLVKMEVPRSPFYEKELDIRMSCSYGPGRYDAEYEERGHDYPYEYVRWTEQRNMEAFLDMLSMKRLKIEPLISHVLSIDEGRKAYDLISGKNREPYLGILLEYPQERLEKTLFVKSAPKNSTEKGISVGFIGAGNFAQSYLMPHVKKCRAHIHTVVTSTGISAKNVADKFHIGSYSTNPEDVLANPDIHAVFIATRHGSHADLTVRALRAGKHVFVEKPIALTEEELKEVILAMEECEGPILQVGYNRRFSPIAMEMQRQWKALPGPSQILYRVNAGAIPDSHWIQDPLEGGGRIIGEACHFVDFFQAATGALLESVQGIGLSRSHGKATKDNVSFQFKLDDGSVATLLYLACGGKVLPKEYVEIHRGGESFIIDDYRQACSYAESSSKTLKLPGKGHKEEVEAFMKTVEEGGPPPIPYDQLINSARAAFRMVEVINTRKSANI